MTEEEFKYDPEQEENTKKYRLPFALCKANGIVIQDWWRPRDAWEALKRGGHVDDVSEEYKEYYRKIKQQEAAENRIKNKARRKAKEAQLKDPQHNPDINYKHLSNHIAGAERGAPMNFEQADSGKVNPFIKQTYNPFTGKGLIGYKTNCQTCVAVYVARRKGYDVRALPNLDNKNIYRLEQCLRMSTKMASTLSN